MQRLATVSFFAAAMALLSLSACASTPQAGDWSESDWALESPDLSRIVVAVLRSSRFGYDIAEFEASPDERRISIRTGWNLNQARYAVFAGAGTRRMAFIEIEQTFSEASDPAMRGGPELGAGETVAKPPSGGKRKLVMSRLSVSVKRERNVDILHPDEPERGTWRADGTDSEEIEHLLAHIQNRVEEITGKQAGMSPRAQAAYERYLRDEAMSPEERERRLAEIRKDMRRDAGDRPLPAAPDGE